MTPSLHIFCKSLRYLVELLLNKFMPISHSWRTFFLLYSVLGISSLNIFLTDVFLLFYGLYYDRRPINDCSYSAICLLMLSILFIISSLSVGLVVANGVPLFYSLISVFCYFSLDRYIGGLSYIFGTVLRQFKSSLSSLLGTVFPLITTSYLKGSLLL